MAAKIPYMLSPSLIPRTLNKIQEAKRPERFTQDFLETKLGLSGGGARPVIPLLKRLGFLAPDGVPTKRYDQYRNEYTRKRAVAEGMKEAFSEIFDRNIYAQELDKAKLTGLVLEITGAAPEDRTTVAIVGTFSALSDLADFDTESEAELIENASISDKIEPPQQASHHSGASIRDATDQVDFRVGYTINLNLPETTDPEVFNAIFKSLKEHLLKNE